MHFLIGSNLKNSKYPSTYNLSHQNKSLNIQCRDGHSYRGEEDEGSRILILLAICSVQLGFLLNLRCKYQGKATF